MNIKTNFNKIISLSLVSLTATSLSFATVTPVKFAFAQQTGQYSGSPDVINAGMNGTWYLEWKVNGWLHKGYLKVTENLGEMVVNVTGPNGRKISAEQRMMIKSQGYGYYLKGSNPTHPVTGKDNPDYQSDTFYVKSDGNGGWRMENCSGDYDCIPVKMTRID